MNERGARKPVLGLTGSILAGIAAAACLTRGPEPEIWEPVPTYALSEAQRVQLERAAAARDALFGQLMSTLSESLLEDGAAVSIRVCKEEAPRIADSLSHELGVRMGRTAVRLRNPDNRAPEWAEPLLIDEPGDPRTSASSKGRLGVTYPIRLKGACTICHGQPDEIPEDVGFALAKHYPSDRATGFKEGDLRGWLWVEVPPAQD